MFNSFVEESLIVGFCYRGWSKQDRLNGRLAALAQSSKARAVAEDTWLLVWSQSLARDSTEYFRNGKTIFQFSRCRIISPFLVCSIR